MPDENKAITISESTDLYDKLPETIFTVSGKTFIFKGFFSFKCSQELLGFIKNGDEPRAAFAKVAFVMCEPSIKKQAVLICQDDFLRASNEELKGIMQDILTSSSNLNGEFEKLEGLGDDYDRFCKAHKNYLLAFIESTDFSQFAKTSLQAESIIKGLNANFNKLANALESAFASIAISVREVTSNLSAGLGVIAESFQKIHAWDDRRKVLLSYGWPFISDIPDSLFDNIYQNRAEYSQDEVDTKVVSYFRKERCKELKRLVKQWQKCSCFVSRKHIWHQAIVNHSRGYYNASITLATIHIEGILTDFVRINMSTPRYHIDKAIDDIQEKLDDSAFQTYWDYLGQSDVLKNIKNLFAESFHPSNPDEAPNTSRHKIAHGHAVELENEQNSLKQFLFLNELYHMFTLLEKKA
ncbi:MAG: hypothetical protein VB099_19845 [Candidatus Limiplasma sp.]|nr:hypothetical protein [Candidatus Limiplasma sp.]